MNSILSKVLNAVKVAPSGGRPPVAVELSPEGVLAAAQSSPSHPPVYAFAPLPAGALVPSTAEANIRAAEAVSAAIRSALDGVSPHGHAVTLVLPDSSVHIFILDFDDLPTKPAEVLPVLRLRLRKMIPFDVEPAGLSYQVLSHDENGYKVLLAVLPGSVLTEYEAVVRSAGYEPGAVLPSSLAALEVIHSMEAVFAVNLSPLSLTTSITTGSDLLLYRTLDLPEEPAARIAEIQRGVAVAAAYFEDKLQAPAHEIRYSGCYDLNEFTQWVSNTGLEVVDLAPHPETGAVTALGRVSIAGATGALAGAS